MATQPHVRNPIEWGWDRLKETGHALGSAANSMDGAWEAHDLAPPVVRKIGIADLRHALAEGARISRPAGRTSSSSASSIPSPA